MFDLPKSTEMRKPIHKNLLYKKFREELSGERKTRFDEDISRIIITNEISENTVNIKGGGGISSIFVVQIELKTRDYSERNIALIARLFGQKLLIVLHCGDMYQLAIYETRLLRSEWKTEEEIHLRVDGLELGTVWNGFVTAVSGISAADGNTLAEQIEIEAEKENLRRRIAELEKRARKEIQSKKKFDLFSQIQEYKKKLEEM